MTGAGADPRQFLRLICGAAEIACYGAAIFLADWLLIGTHQP